MILVSFMLFAVSAMAEGQTPVETEKRPRSAIDMEILGNSWRYSIGYSFSINPNLRLRVGYGSIKLKDDNWDYTNRYSKHRNFPVIFEYLLPYDFDFPKGNNHFLLISAGVRWVKIETDQPENVYVWPLQIINGNYHNKWMLQPTIALGYQYDKKWFYINGKMSITYFEYARPYNALIVPGVGSGFKF